MALQIVDAEIAPTFGEIGVVLARDEAEHVAEVVNGVIDGRRGEVEDLLGTATRLGDGALELAVTGRRACSGAGHAGVAEVVGLVDQDDGGVLHRAFDAVRPFSPALQVGVAVADEGLHLRSMRGCTLLTCQAAFSIILALFQPVRAREQAP